MVNRTEEDAVSRIDALLWSCDVPRNNVGSFECGLNGETTHSALISICLSDGPAKDVLRYASTGHSDIHVKSLVWAFKECFNECIFVFIRCELQEWVGYGIPVCIEDQSQSSFKIIQRPGHKAGAGKFVVLANDKRRQGR